MTIGHLFGGFTRGFGEARQKAQDNARIAKMDKLQGQLVELKLAEARRQSALTDNLKGLFGPAGAPQPPQASPAPAPPDILSQLSRAGLPPEGGAGAGPGTAGPSLAPQQSPIPSPVSAPQAPSGGSRITGQQLAGAGVPVAQIPSLLKAFQPVKRETLTDAAGFQRFVDTRDRVFPDVDAPPRSKLGREAFDAEHFGADSPQFKALQELRAAPDVKATFDRGTTLRKEFTRLSEDNLTGLSSFNKLWTAAQDPTGAGDIAMVFAFMKLLDPGSRVTEGETAQASNVSGSASKFLNVYNRVVKGEVLTGTARQDILFQAGKIATQTVKEQRGFEDTYRGRAKRAKVDERDVITDFITDTESRLEGLQKPERNISTTIKKAEQSLDFPAKVIGAAGAAVGGLVDRVTGDAPPPPPGFVVQ